MARGFAGLVAINTTPKTVATMLAAAGYTGSMVGKYMLIANNVGLQIIYRGDSSSVSAANGIAMDATTGLFEREADSPADAIDAGAIWLVRAAASGSVSITWEPL